MRRDRCGKNRGSTREAPGVARQTQARSHKRELQAKALQEMERESRRMQSGQCAEWRLVGRATPSALGESTVGDAVTETLDKRAAAW